MSVPPLLLGSKVNLGPMPESTDFQALYRTWLNSPRVVEGIGGGDCSLEDVRALHKQWKDDPNDCSFCVFDRQSGEPIGDVNLRLSGGEADLAVMIGARPGEGLGTEAVALALEYAFEELQVEKVRLDVFEENSAALRLYGKLGFQTTDFVLDESTGRMEYAMAMDQDEWLRRGRERPDSQDRATAPR